MDGNVQAAKIPFIQEAEEHVIGSVLINPNVFYGLSAILDTDDFFLLRHQYIWKAFKALSYRKEPIEITGLKTELGEKALSEIGGGAYLTQLINATPTAAYAEAYARLVLRTSQRRRLLKAADDLKAVLIDENIVFEDVQAQAERILIDNMPEQVGRTRSMLEAINEHMEMVEAAREGKRQTGIPSWHPEITAMIEGYERGRLYLVAARPGHGKTSFALREALHMESMGSTVVICSQEMSTEQITGDLLAMESRIPARVMQRGMHYEQDWSRYVETAGRLSKRNIYIDDTPALTPERLWVNVQRWSRQFRLGAVIVDYIQLMNGGPQYKGNREQEIALISRTLKEIARTFNVPVIALSQLSRDVEKRGDKRPVSSDLRDSGQLEQDADVIMFLYQGDRYAGLETMPPFVETEHIFTKNRGGALGTVKSQFWGRYKMFVLSEQVKRLAEADKAASDARVAFYKPQPLAPQPVTSENGHKEGVA